jgi:Flp pilus assembly protein TadD
MRGLLHIRIMGALFACAGLSVIVAAAPVAAQGSYSSYAETPSTALARYVHVLANDPKDFSALIGAGRAALELGDAQAAAGFFARADEANPRSPLPQAGMGAVSVANGDAKGSLPYFKRAQQLGASAVSFGADRGLAYDLLGRQADAQADYRAALGGADGDEARRRLALSLAISGDKAGALQILAPLMAKGDAGAARSRAFALALCGDSQGAMVAIDAAMPGSWSRVAPFLQRLPGLQAGQKAAAVNLGIFPDSGDTAYAYAAPTRSYPTSPSVSNDVSSNRLVGIDELLRGPADAAPPAPPPLQPPSWQAAPVQLAYSPPVQRQAVQAPRTASVAPRKIWLQLASGDDAAALPSQFQRIKSKSRELFDGIHPYVARGADRARLLIGPFRNASDADTFAEDLETVDITAFKWSNSESDQIVPLGTE